MFGKEIFINKKILIYGLGLSGKSCLQYLYKNNKVIVFDDNKSLKNTLTSGLKDLDGFYTFIAGTRKGFAVVRDEIACKPAVIAETKNYVAIA